MKEYLPVLSRARLFAGVAPDELESVLNCLEARPVRYEKGEYILRAGAAVESLGLLAAGDAFIIQEDFWGNRNLLSAIEPGQCFAESFACAPGSASTVSVVAQAESAVLWLNVRRLLGLCPSGCRHHSAILQNLLADLAGYFRGVGRVYTPLAATTLHISVRVVLSYLWAGRLGLRAVALATGVGWLCLTAFQLTMLWRIRRRPRPAVG